MVVVGEAEGPVVEAVDVVVSVVVVAVSLASALESVTVADANVAWADTTAALRSATSSDANVCPSVTVWPTDTSTALDRAGHVEVEVRLVDRRDGAHRGERRHHRSGPDRRRSDRRARRYGSTANRSGPPPTGRRRARCGKVRSIRIRDAAGPHCRTRREIRPPPPRSGGRPLPPAVFPSQAPPVLPAGGPPGPPAPPPPRPNPPNPVVQLPETGADSEIELAVIAPVLLAVPTAWAHLPTARSEDDAEVRSVKVVEPVRVTTTLAAALVRGIGLGDIDGRTGHRGHRTGGDGEVPAGPVAEAAST